MKRLLYLSLLFGLLVTAASAQVRGELDDSHEIPILRLWGTPYEMGYAHGYLMGDRVRQEYDGYIAPLTLHNKEIYEAFVDLFERLYTVPSRYQQEAEGLIDGAIGAGFDLFIPHLGRELNATDLAVTGAMPDIVGLVSCSSLIAWDNATINDQVLEGKLAVVRNMDWLALPLDPSFMARQTIIIARQPNDRRATLSVYFPGLIGCLSCMNDAGVVALQHQVHPGVLFINRDYSEKFVPINIAMREGLELYDPDNDGQSTVDDVALVVEELPKSSQYNVVLADKNPDFSPPMSLETANNGSARRYDLDDPGFPKGTLGITNHFRKLKDPHYCKRYMTIQENAKDWYGDISLERLWENNNQVAMKFPLGSITAQTMIFIPSMMRLGVAFSDEHHFAPEKDPIWLEWSDAFPTMDLDDDDDDDDDDTNDYDTSFSANGESDENHSCGCGS